MTKEGALTVNDSSPMGAVSEAWSQKVYDFGSRVIGTEAEVKINVEQHLHAGMYSRTAVVPKGTLCFGVMIHVPTQLIVHGKALFITEGGSFEVDGFRVLEGLAGRQAGAVTYEDTLMSMCFATNAKTIEEAEREFAGDDFFRLANHRSEE